MATGRMAAWAPSPYWYRGWDNNPQEKFKVQVDINGAGFTDISSEISPTLTYTEFTYDLNNASDNIIVRIQQTAGERILIDDASIGDYSGGSTPTITLSSGDLSAFSTTYGIASAAQSFTVAGSDLTANITVTAPSGYNVSLSSGSGYGSSVSLTPSGGTVSETTVYVRLTGAATGAFSGNVSATSTDAAEKTKAVSGTVGLAAPTGVVASETNATDFTASWSAVSGASGYRLDVSEYEEFCTTGGTPENLMSNAGFETGDGTDWDKFETEYSVVTTDPQEGTYHVAVTATATRDLTQNVSITGDGVTEYEISYWYKGTGNLRIWAAWTTGGQVSGDSLQPSSYNDAASEWTKMTYTVVPQSGDNVLFYEIRAYNGASMYLDNFFVGTTAGGCTPSFVGSYEDYEVASGTSQIVEGLDPETTYYFRVRATDGTATSANSSTGSVETLAESASAPSVTTADASSIGATSATLGGNVTSDGGDAVTDRGVVYKAGSGVTISDNKTQIGSGTGEFGQSIGSLSVNTHYYFRAYATNTVGATLGSELDFWTLAAVPEAPIVGNPTETSLDITLDADSNPAGTEYAIQRTSDSKYLQDDGTWGDTAVWQTTNNWDTITAGDLTPATTYYFQVKARNGANVETAFGDTGSGTTEESGAPVRWTTLVHQGTPVYTYYLGDELLYQFQYAINTDTTGWTVDYGLGKSTDGSSWTWNGGTYASNNNSDVYWTSDQSEFQFTDTGNYYYAGRFNDGTYSYYAMDDWTDDNLVLAAVNYFTVNAINDPFGQTAAANASAPTTAIDLDWTENAQSHDVMVVRKLTSESWTEPTQGTGYSAPGTLGDGDIIYIGSAGEFTDDSLAEDTTYDYKFYSVNNDYYSSGVTAQGATDPCEPNAPTGLYASETNDTSFTASWTAPAAGNPPTNYYIDVSTEEDFEVASVASDLFFSEYIEGSSNEKYIEIFNGTGASVDLSDYALILFANGGTAHTASNVLSGTLANGAVAVYRNSSATNLIGTTATAAGWNGDDAVALWKQSTTSFVDIFGRIGEDPGSAWTDGSFTTVNKTLVRKSSVSGGVTSNPESGFPTLGTEWDQYDQDVEEYLESHTFSGGTTPSYVAGYENLSVGNVTSFEVEDLDPETTYYFRVRGEGEESCVGADSTVANVTTLEEEVTDYYTLLNDRGAPWKTYTLGDMLADQFQFAINTDTSGWDVEYGLGQSTDGTDWTWTDATYVSNNVNDRYWTSPTGAGQFTAVGDWYYAGRFTSLEPRIYYAAIDWTNTPDNLTLAAASYITVEAIVDPSAQTATTSSTDPTGSIDLEWTQNGNGNNVMIVRKPSWASWTEPTQGTQYAVDNPLGNGTVIYNGAGTDFTDIGLTADTTYDYKFYSVNYNYYSAGVIAQASTLACEPDAPTGLNATGTDSDSFTANWTASDRATNYFIDVSLEENFQSGAGGLFISEVADPSDVANARFVELYNASGNAIDFGTTTWYLSRQANGSTWGDILLTGTIPAGGTYVVAYSETTFTNAFYPKLADQYNANISGNGNDGYFLYSGGDHTAGTLVDAYGVIDQDGTGQTWEYTDKHAVRDSDVAVPNSTWTADEWTISSAAVADMTPGDHTCSGGGTASYVPGYENLLVGNLTSVDVTGLCPNRIYYFRVRAQGEGGCTGANSATANETTDKGVLTVTGLTGDNKPYDGTTDATASGTATLDGILCEDAVTLAGTPVYTFAQADVGTDIEITTSGYTLAGDDAGNYDLTQPTLSADITAKEITVTPDADQSKVYGAADPAFAYTLSEEVDVTGALGRVAGEDVGSYAFTLGDLSAGGNYSLSLAAEAEEFEITAKEITVTPDADQSKVYGAADPAFAYTLSEEVDVTGALGRVAGEDVGSYAFTLGDLSAGDNYSLSLAAEAEEFEITAKEITVTPDADQSKVYGAADPAFSYTLSEEVDVTGALGRVAGEDVGFYAFTLGNLDAGDNYSLSLAAEAEEFEITKATPVIETEPTASTITFGDTLADSDLTGGLASVAGTFAWTTPATAPDAGTADQSVTFTPDDAVNYEAVVFNVSVTVDKANQTITFEGGAWQSKTYGDASFEITATASSGLTVEFDSSDETVATVNSPVTIVGAGTTTITATQPGDDNWNAATPVQHDLEVDQLAVTVTPTPGLSKEEGASDPTFTYTTDPELLGSDTLAGALGRASGETVGFYAYNLGTLANDNYALSLSEESDQFEIVEPSSVVLYYFIARAENGQAVLRWRTASELDTVGFWVERLNGEAWVRVNDKIIYGKDEMGATYALVDAGAEVGGTYTWRIVEIETDGSQQIYGPFTRTVSELGFAEENPITVTPDGILIRWLSREGESYKILRSTDLTQGFEIIAEDISATVPENEFLDEGAGSIGMYLIQVDED